MREHEWLRLFVPILEVIKAPASSDKRSLLIIRAMAANRDEARYEIFGFGIKILTRIFQEKGEEFAEAILSGLKV